MIWIRADAGKEIGTGHIMRCLSVALEAAGLGRKVCFLTADEESAEFLRTRGILPEGNPGSRILGTDYREMGREPEILEEILSGEPGPILVDSYFAGPDYLKELRRMTHVTYMDDLHRFPCPADRIVNYNIYADPQDYAAERRERGAECFLGPKYAPLRAQFRNVPYQVRQKARRIFLTTGGADRYDLTGQILGALLGMEEFEGMEFVAVSGAMNRNYGKLERLSAEDRRVEVRSNVSDMAGLMASCDLAVTAGGSTVYELCAVGVPFLCFSFAENQERAVRTFAESGLAAFGGDYLRGGEKMILELTDALRELAPDYERRRSLSAAQRRLVDSLGARRIAEELVKWENRDKR